MPWSDQKQQSQKKYKVSYHVYDGVVRTPFATFKPAKDKPSQPGPVDTSSIIPYSEKTSSRNTNIVENIVTRGLPISTNTTKLGYDRLQLQNAKNTFHTKATGGQIGNLRQLVKQQPIEYTNPISGNNVIDSLKLELYKDGNPLKNESGGIYGIDIISATIQANLEANVSTFEFIGGNGSYKQLINSGDYNINIDFILTPGCIKPLDLQSLDFSGNGGTNPLYEQNDTKEYTNLKEIDGFLKKTAGALNNAANWVTNNKNNINKVLRTASAIGTTTRQVMSGNLADLNWLRPMEGMVDYDLKPDNELQLLCAILRFVCKYPFAYQLHITNRYLNQLGVEYLCPISWSTNTTDDFTNTYRLSLEALGE